MSTGAEGRYNASLAGAPVRSKGSSSWTRHPPLSRGFESDMVDMNVHPTISKNSLADSNEKRFMKKGSDPGPGSLDGIESVADPVK